MFLSKQFVVYDDPERTTVALCMLVLISRSVKTTKSSLRATDIPSENFHLAVISPVSADEYAIVNVVTFRSTVPPLVNKRRTHVGISLYQIHKCLAPQQSYNKQMKETK